MQLIVRSSSSSTGMHVPPEPVVPPVIGVDATMIAHGSTIPLPPLSMVGEASIPVLFDPPQPASAHTTSDVLLIASSVLRRTRAVEIRAPPHRRSAKTP